MRTLYDCYHGASFFFKFENYLYLFERLILKLEYFILKFINLRLKFSIFLFKRWYAFRSFLWHLLGVFLHRIVLLFGLGKYITITYK